MNKKSVWHLDITEVAEDFFGASSGKSGQFSRVLKTTSGTLSLTHTPTGITVTGEIPAGHYSKKTMQEKRKALKTALLAKLEDKVAKHLRISGR